MAVVANQAVAFDKSMLTAESVYSLTNGDKLSLQNSKIELHRKSRESHFSPDDPIPCRYSPASARHARALAVVSSTKVFFPFR